MCWRRIEEEYAGRVDLEWRAFLLRPRPPQSGKRDLEEFREYTKSWLRPAAEPDSGDFRVWDGDAGPPSHSVPAHTVAKAALRLSHEAFERIHDRLLRAYFSENRDISDDAVLERPMALPWIEGSGAEVLASYFSELTVHTWDLATATGQQPDWDDTVVAAALEARQILPAQNRRALYEEISTAMGLDEVAVPFAEAVPIPDDAPAIDRLVAWNGRDPLR